MVKPVHQIKTWERIDGIKKELDYPLPPFGVEIDDAEITSDQKNFGKCAHTQ